MCTGKAFFSKPKHQSIFLKVNWMAFGVIIYKVFRQTAMLKPEVSCYENIR